MIIKLLTSFDRGDIHQDCLTNYNNRFFTQELEPGQ